MQRDYYCSATPTILPRIPPAAQEHDQRKRNNQNSAPRRWLRNGYWNRSHADIVTQAATAGILCRSRPVARGQIHRIGYAQAAQIRPSLFKERGFAAIRRPESAESQARRNNGGSLNVAAHRRFGSGKPDDVPGRSCYGIRDAVGKPVLPGNRKNGWKHKLACRISAYAIYGIISSATVCAQSIQSGLRLNSHTWQNSRRSREYEIGKNVVLKTAARRTKCNVLAERAAVTLDRIRSHQPASHQHKEARSYGFAGHEAMLRSLGFDDQKGLHSEQT
jgi:hypothetical protein